MKIEYYYGVPSPFAYLGSLKFQNIAKKYAAEIVEKPCDLVGGIFVKTGGIPVPQRSTQRQKYRLDEIKSIRGTRYFGPSQMSFFKLIVHSLSIIAVFKYRVFFTSFILVSLSQYVAIITKSNFLFFQAVLFLFNLLVLIISLRENGIGLKNSELNIRSIEEITH